MTIPARTPEKPVFAATSRVRPHGLRLAGRIGAGLAALWLVALVLGAFGLGRLPGVNLPRITGGEPDAATAPASKPGPSTRAASGTREHLKSGSRYGSGPAPAERRGSPTANAAPPRRVGAVRTGPTTASPGSRGGASTGTATNAGPIASPSPATGASPTTSTSQGNSQTATTPPGSSSTAPGSRSQATTAPGREHSTATPTPGTGNGGSSDAEHGPKPK